MQYSVDYFKIFEQLPEPVALCDEEGLIYVMNQAAIRFLGPVAGESVRVILTARETVRQMRMTANNVNEFFLAEVKVEHSVRERVSVSLSSLEDGGYRLVLSAAGTSGTAPNLRMLESLVNVNRHLQLFRTPEKVIEFFASSFGEVFPEYAFHVEAAPKGLPPLVFRHQGWEGASASKPDVSDFDLPHVPADGLLWSKAGRGYRLAPSDFGDFSGFFQVERKSSERFSVNEREAMEIFLQQLLFALSRVWQRDPDLSMVTPIINQLDAVVIVCDARRRIRVANQTFESLVYADEILGRDILEFFSESTGTHLRTSAASVMAGVAVESFEAALVNGDGTSSSQVILNIQISPNHMGASSSGGFIITGQLSDVSIVELEDRLSRAEHLMNIGELATGVAHELKNPLTSILNYADYLLQKYEDVLFEDRDKARLKRIIEGVEHIEEFIQDLMTLARPEENDWGSVDLHRTIKESAAMCEIHLHQHKVQLAYDLAPNTLHFHGAQGQVRQVFINLLTNAAKALPAEGGTITIRTRSDGKVITCDVVDTGGGISPEHQERIFDPFFTTREGSGGTGLGLAIVHSMMKRHQGNIQLTSALGQGTTFHLTFPEGPE